MSYDTYVTVKCARSIIKVYESMGVLKDHILIKLAGTWERIQASKILNVNINLKSYPAIVYLIG